MRPQSNSPPPADWRVFLDLGTRLLKLASTREQCLLVNRFIETRYPVAAKTWLMPEYYPLPGEEGVDLLDESRASPEIMEAVDTRQLSMGGNSAFEYSRSLALPLLSNDTLLGVLSVECLPGWQFSEESLSFLEGLAAHVSVAMQTARQTSIKRWRYEQLALVRSVSDQVASVGDLDELCRQVTRSILDTFKYYYVAIFTVESGQEPLRLRAYASKDGSLEGRPAFEVSVGEAMIGYVAETGEELLANDVRLEPRYQSVAALPETRGEFCLPVKLEGAVLGVLDVQSDQLYDFHEIDMLVLHSLADSIALAIDGIRNLSRLEERAVELAAVFEFSRALNSILDPEELLGALTGLIHERFGFPHVYVYTVHSGRRKVIFGTGSGARSTAYLESDLQFDMDDPLGIIPAVARGGKTILSNDVSREPLYRVTSLPPDNTRSELTIPLIFGENVLGVLDIQSDRLNAFSAADVSRFEALAASIAVAMRNALLYRTEKWRLQVAESMRDVAVLVSANMEVSALLDTILTRLEKTLPSEASAVWLVEPGETHNGGQPHRLYLAAVHGLPADRARGIRKEPESAWKRLDEALHSARPQIRKPGDAYDPLGSALGLPGDYSSICAPLHSGGHPLGVISLVHSTPFRYGTETSTITATYASYASVAIQNARLFEMAQEQARKAIVLLEAGEAFRSVEKEHDLLEKLLDVLVESIGIGRCGLFLWEGRYRVFSSNVSRGMPGFPARADFTLEDNPALEKVHDTRMPLVLHPHNPGLTLAAAWNDPGDEMAIFYPLALRDTLLGALLVFYQPDATEEMDDPLKDEKLAILQSVVNQAAVALENLRLEESRRQEAYVTEALLAVAQAVVSQNDLVDILKTIVELLPALVGIDTCIIYFWDKADAMYHPYQAFAGTPEYEAEIMGKAFSGEDFALLNLIRESNQVFTCLQEECSDSLDDWMKLECGIGLHPEQRERSECRTWLMGFPLTVKGEGLGVMLIKESEDNYVPHEKRLEILQGVSRQIALAFQNEAYHLDMVNRERTESEFQLARQIQQNFLPESLPRVEGWELDAYWQTARQVGGDLYDIFWLDDVCLGIVIADVSDKGMPAALYMTVTHALIRAHAMNIKTPATLLERVNHFLQSESQNGMFVTAVYTILDTQTGMLDYANAGHNMPLVLRSASGSVHRLPHGGMAMGVVDEYRLTNHELKLEPGDTLLFYTDGISETFSPSGKAFGEGRLEALLREMKGAPVSEILQRVEAEVASFREETTPGDDITMVGLRRV